MRPPGADRVGLAGLQPDFLLRLAQEQTQAALEHVKGVLDVVVIVPGHLLARTDLQLRDPEALTLGVSRAALDLVQMARVLDRLHGKSSSSTAMGTSDPAATCPGENDWTLGQGHHRSPERRRRRPHQRRGWRVSPGSQTTKRSRQ